ncbi:hypothetical protein B0H16DRAFT_1584846 [Mycena metata]|uniref:F-box domain-containing protein n=1 Tax=Mycena metata TaxID=1033252 RepID=A0AAD7HZE2_9AGAR|nr:hypothetical protein B0H16DRAFT_1584846 [Mycena metata]
MHRALQVPELVELICTEVDQSSLYPLAQVQIFSEPALDRLWRTQSSLVNVLLCMGQDLWEVNGTSRRDKFVYARRAIEPRDWQRFHIYARRIKHLWLADHHYSAIDEDTWSPVLEMLAVCLPVRPLFPNLQDLHWSVHTRPWFSYVHLFLAPRLETITLGILDGFVHFSMLPTLPTQCPLLTSVTIFGKADINTPYATCSLMIRGLRHLKELDVGYVDRDAFQYLEDLPTLEKLALQRAPEFGPLTLLHDRQTFPRLRDLAVRDTPHQHLAGLLGTNSAWSLTHFLAHIINNPLSTHMAQIYSLLASRSDPVVLIHLTIEAFVGRSDIGGITGDHLSPLLAFKNLQHVKLTFPTGFNLDDTAVESLARAWPQLWSLELRSGLFRSTSPRITLGGVRALARHCRDLNVLALAFDASVVPDDGAPPVAEQGCLRFLKVEDGVLVDPTPVAAYLMALFPRLQQIHPPSLDDDEEMDDAEWERMTNLYSLWVEAESQRRDA